MDDESGYEVIEELDLMEEPVPQIYDDHDTAPMESPVRASTFSDWPPEPPLPAFDDHHDLAVGTVDGVPPPRTASIFAAVARPPTDSEGD